MAPFQLYCDGCGRWHTFRTDDDGPTCPTCRTARWLDDNEPRGRSAGLAEFYGADLDTFSDADPGL